MIGQKYKWRATARVSFPYHFEPLIFETEEQVKEDTIKDIRENICICKNEIKISDLNIENLGPWDAGENYQSLEEREGVNHGKGKKTI